MSWSDDRAVDTVHWKILKNHLKPNVWPTSRELLKYKQELDTSRWVIKIIRRLRRFDNRNRYRASYSNLVGTYLFNIRYTRVGTIICVPTLSCFRHADLNQLASSVQEMKKKLSYLKKTALDVNKIKIVGMWKLLYLI